VYSWGVNSYGQTGIAENAGEKEAVTLGPTVIKSVWSHGRVTCIAGVNHHRIAVIEDGECLVWGRLDSYTAGLKSTAFRPKTSYETREVTLRF
jgi:regulator of chromosome condensation